MDSLPEKKPEDQILKEKEADVAHGEAGEDGNALETSTQPSDKPKKKKKNKRRKKNGGGGGGGAGEDEGEEGDEEEKEGDQASKTPSQPMDDLSQALRELNIDRNAPDFSVQDTIDKFVAMSKDSNVHFLEQARYRHLAVLMGEHKYWLSEAVVKPGEESGKIGPIKHFKKEDIR